MPSSTSVKYLLPLLSSSLIVGGMWYFSRSHTPASDADKALPVRVTQARRVSSTVTIRTTGELQPANQAEVVSILAGKVTELRVKVGDYVKAGSMVAVVSGTELDQRIARVEASIAQAEENLRASKSELTEAERQLARAREIFERDLIARRDLEQTASIAETARAQAELAAAHLAQQQAMLAQVQSLESVTRLSAPISGEVTSVRVTPGRSVGEGGVILTLASMDAFKLTIGVDGLGAAGVKRGGKARIFNPNLGSISVEGEIVRIGPGKSGSVGGEIEIHLANDGKRFRPGMLVEAAIDVPLSKESLWISRRAVISEDRENYVYRISDGLAVRERVVLGPEQGEDIAILEGVHDGESIILDVVGIGPGRRVRPVDAHVGATQPAN